MDDTIKELIAIADRNNGHCDRCNRVIKIYRYKINKDHARTLKAMAEQVEANNENIIDFRKLDLRYAAKTQITKLRLHGLIAKYKVDGVHKASHWVITTKGYRFLNGEDIPKTVIVFDNQVLGHDDGVVNIKQLADDAPYEESPITTAEAEVYSDVRTPRKNVRYYAQFKGKTVPPLDSEVVREIKIESLQIGKPIKLVKPFVATYPDIAAFCKYWKIIKEIK